MAKGRRRAAAVVFGLLLVLATVGAWAGAPFVFSRYLHPQSLTTDRELLAPSPWAPSDGRFHCAPVSGDRWSPLPGLEYTGRLGIALPPSSAGAMVMVVGDALPLQIDIETAGAAYLPARKEILQLGSGAGGPPPDYWLDDGTPWDAPAHVQQLTLSAAPDGDRFISVRFGRRAPRVFARLRGHDDAARATICAASLGVAEAFEGERREAMVFPHSPEYFGTGWSGLQHEPPGGGRWMIDHGAILIPSARRGAVHVTLRASAGSRTRDATIALRVNDVALLGERPLREGMSAYEWDIPQRAWIEGTNELLFSVAGLAKPARLSAPSAHAFGVALQRLELRME